MSTALDTGADYLVDVAVNPPLAVASLRDRAGRNRISVALGRGLVAKLAALGPTRR
jgi:hypothetical protein